MDYDVHVLVNTLFCARFAEGSRRLNLLNQAYDLICQFFPITVFMSCPISSIFELKEEDFPPNK
jgi:ABC-type transporter Mla maintaining outer membrane lipid asymmetry permease subunit MlaE